MASGELHADWGRRVRDRRVEVLGPRTLRRLASLIDVAPGHLSQIEHGRCGIGDGLRVLLARELRCRVVDLCPYPGDLDGH